MKALRKIAVLLVLLAMTSVLVAGQGFSCMEKKLKQRAAISHFNAEVVNPTPVGTSCELKQAANSTKTLAVESQGQHQVLPVTATPEHDSAPDPHSAPQNIFANGPSPDSPVSRTPLRI